MSLRSATRRILRFPGAGVLTSRSRRGFRHKVVYWERRPAADHDAAVADPAADGLWLGRYDRPEDVPVTFYRVVGTTALDRLLDEFLKGGALWVLWVAGRPSGYLWTREAVGADFGPVPLGPKDVAVLPMGLAPLRMNFKGPALAEVCRRVVPAGGRAFGRCFARETELAEAFRSAGFDQMVVSDG